ncbi:MAG: selenide, water dikinase SelD [Candidatus Cloacimonetes bacterium]|nr:selenide, water dikinase SelD [Candidatus Cloacimonadota bacterium]
MDPPRLTQYSQYAGCGAKLGPCVLNKTLSGIRQAENPALLVDFHHAEDAGIYQITDELAIVQTVDFFPPIVDDPYTFGQITAANALSDIYAMGGRPITALSLVCFPIDKLDAGVLGDIQRGGLSKLDEAGVMLLGGHSIKDADVKYGFAVTGLVHPDKYLLNNTLRAGDALLLTKPLGNGIINTALRVGKAEAAHVAAATRLMVQLNKLPAELAAKYTVHACTDITGFGLLGHLGEMIEGTGLGARVRWRDVPLMPGTLDYARDGFVPGGARSNRDYRLQMMAGHDQIPPEVIDILFDPQTSGGLLFALSPDQANELLGDLTDAGFDAALVGEVIEREVLQIEQ